MAWSADFPADDWKHISAQEVVKRALSRLEIHHKGILLLHDIHPNTAAALPVLLRDLKARGYHIVQVVPATPTLPKTPTTPDQWLMRPLPVPPVPDLLDVSVVGSIPGLPITTQNGASDHPFGKLLIPISTREEKPLRSRKHGRRHLRRGTAWPQGGQSARGEAESGVAALPAPNPDVFKPLMPSETAAEAAAEARAAENAVAHADVARIVAPKAVPLPAVRPGRPKPLPTVQPEPAEPLEIVPPAGATAPAKPTFGAGLLPALIAHLWNRS
jgi:hypothetical protein